MAGPPAVSWSRVIGRDMQTACLDGQVCRMGPVCPSLAVPDAVHHLCQGLAAAAAAVTAGGAGDAAAASRTLASFVAGAVTPTVTGREGWTVEAALRTVAAPDPATPAVHVAIAHLQLIALYAFALPHPLLTPTELEALAAVIPCPTPAPWPPTLPEPLPPHTVEAIRQWWARLPRLARNVLSTVLPALHACATAAAGGGDGGSGGHCPPQSVSNMADLLVLCITRPRADASGAVAGWNALPPGLSHALATTACRVHPGALGDASPPLHHGGGSSGSITPPGPLPHAAAVASDDGAEAEVVGGNGTAGRSDSDGSRGGAGGEGASSPPLPLPVPAPSLIQALVGVLPGFRARSGTSDSVASLPGGPFTLPPPNTMHAPTAPVAPPATGTSHGTWTSTIVLPAQATMHDIVNSVRIRVPTATVNVWATAVTLLVQCAPLVTSWAQATWEVERRQLAAAMATVLHAHIALTTGFDAQEPHHIIALRTLFEACEPALSQVLDVEGQPSVVTFSPRHVAWKMLGFTSADPTPDLAAPATTGQLVPPLTAFLPSTGSTLVTSTSAPAGLLPLHVMIYLAHRDAPAFKDDLIRNVAGDASAGVLWYPWAATVIAVTHALAEACGLTVAGGGRGAAGRLDAMFHPTSLATTVPLLWASMYWWDAALHVDAEGSGGVEVDGATSGTASGLPWAPPSPTLLHVIGVACDAVRRLWTASPGGTPLSYLPSIIHAVVTTTLQTHTLLSLLPWAAGWTHPPTVGQEPAVPPPTSPHVPPTMFADMAEGVVRRVAAANTLLPPPPPTSSGGSTGSARATTTSLGSGVEVSVTSSVPTTPPFASTPRHVAMEGHTSTGHPSVTAMDGGGMPLPPPALQPSTHGDVGGVPGAAASATTAQLHGPVLWDVASEIVTPDQASALVACLPTTYRDCIWHGAYSLSRHGALLDTLLTRCQSTPATLFIMRDDGDVVFGGFAAEAWSTTTIGHYYGSGQSFVFSFTTPHAFLEARPRMFDLHDALDAPKPLVVGGDVVGYAYRWSRLNKYFQTVSLAEGIGMGGGGHFAFHLSPDLGRGHSGTCDTFASPCLAHRDMFTCCRLEVYALLRPAQAIARGIAAVPATAARVVGGMAASGAGAEHGGDGGAMARAPLS